jgi:hypothetical protein
LSTSGETLRLQFPNEDLGFSYKEGAIATGQDKHGHAEGLDKGQRVAKYEPKAEPG